MKSFQYAIIFAAILAVSPCFAQMPAPSGYWNFEGVAGNSIPNLGSAGSAWDGIGIFRDDPGVAFHGLEFTSTPWGTGATIRQYGNNDGGYIQLPITSNESFTLETWVKANTGNWRGNGPMLSAREDYGMILHPDFNGRTVTGFLCGPNVPAVGNYTNIGTSAALVISQWHHYALSYDSDTGRAAYYVDGRLVSAQTVNLDRPDSNSLTINVGRDFMSAADIRTINATFDEIRYYDTALTDRQMLTSYVEHFNQKPQPGFSVGKFSSVADLDLTGNFVYAINLGVGSGSWQVSDDVTFRGENDVTGLGMTRMTGLASWGNRPNFGGNPSGSETDVYNSRLEDVCQGIRYVRDTENPLQGNITLGVTPGQAYKLQLLVSLNDRQDRAFGLSLGGRKVLEEFQTLQFQEFNGNNPTNGVVLTYEFIATKSTFGIDGFNGIFGAHVLNEAIFNALTLEHLADAINKAIPLKSADDLHLDRGHIIYAVNAGNTSVTQDVEIRGVTFYKDDHYGSDVVIRANNATGPPGWGANPAPGTDDAGLDLLLGTIRFDESGHTWYDGIEMHLAVEPGRHYELDLLFHDTSGIGGRSCDVFLDDLLMVEGFDIRAVGDVGGTSNAMLTLSYTATSEMMDILLAHNAWTGDMNPVLSGFMLRDVSDVIPEPGTWGMMLLGGAVVAGVYRRRKN